MDEFDRRVFAQLFNAVVQQCFGHALDGPLSEPESKHLSAEIEEKTGLVIGWKSVKNYAAYLLNSSPDKSVNPSVATLDTLARYALNAPITSEAERKKTGEHFTYWFRYREQVGALPVATIPSADKSQTGRLYGVLMGLAITLLVAGFFFWRAANLDHMQDDFRSTDESTLAKNGWFVQHKNSAYWQRRTERPGNLTLFTLEGDTWPQARQIPRVQNLVLRKIQDDCFHTEVHFTDFVPSANWQQAGILLAEDTLFTGKSIRLSLSYNNFFGGYTRPGEVLIQAVASYGKGYTNLEEFVHQPLFPMGSSEERRIAGINLKNVAFRVEKQGKTFRFLYSASPVDNFSFKELTRYESDIKPAYLGLFALKGFVDSTAVIPVSVRYFRLDGQRCE